jgi:hypothetical protein
MSSKFKKKKIALIAGVMLPLFVLFFLLMPHHHPMILPQSILQLRLTEELRGKQAQELVDAMHKESVTPDETAVGTYFSTDGSAKLYLSFYDSRKTAEEQFDRMINLLRLEKGPYSQFRELQVLHEKVYTCLGLGQVHYFFLYERELYWWAVDLQIAQTSMQELIRLVQNSKKNKLKQE